MFFHFKNNIMGPDWCGSVSWTLFSKLKGHWFDSWLGRTPGFQTRSLTGGMREATDRCFSFSVSPSLPLSLKINKNKIFVKAILQCNTHNNIYHLNHFKCVLSTLLCKHISSQFQNVFHLAKLKFYLCPLNNDSSFIPPSPFSPWKSPFYFLSL